MNYRGDNGRFRQALMESGFTSRATSSIFNDNSKARPSTNVRRLKLWFADAVFNAPQQQQRKLERALRKQFGDRIISMYFIPGAHSWYRPDDGTKSLCIKLRDNV